MSWRDREIFIDESRAIGVTMGETDNKKALDQRRKQLLKEKRKKTVQISLDTSILSRRILPYIVHMYSPTYILLNPCVNTGNIDNIIT